MNQRLENLRNKVRNREYKKYHLEKVPNFVEEFDKEKKLDELNWALYGLLDGIHQIAWQIYPFLPNTSLEIAKALNIKGLLKEIPLEKDSWVNIKSGTKIKKGKSLFPRI